MPNPTIPERLSSMESNQHNFAEAIKEIKEQLEKQNQKLDELNKKFDELSGAKRTLIYLTGVALTVAGLIIAFLNSYKG